MADALNVLPMLIAHNQANLVIGYIVFLCQLLTFVRFGSKFSAYFHNLRFIKFGGFILNTIKGFVATFYVPVTHIISVSSQKQMVRANARRVIAFVQNIQLLIKSAVGQLIGYPMCHCMATIQRKMSVAFLTFTRCPNPTIFSFLNFRPETVGNRFFIHNANYSIV